MLQPGHIQRNSDVLDDLNGLTDHFPKLNFHFSGPIL